MDDTQLHALRRDPSAEFAERLRARLDTSTTGGAPPRMPRWRMRSLAFAAIPGAIAAVLIASPQARASAASFLAMFREVNFIALPLDAGRLETLKSQQLDLPQLIGERLEVLEEPGPAAIAVSVEQASTLAGIEVREPAYLPRLPSEAFTKTTLVGIEVRGALRARVTADGERLREVMNVLGIHDLEVPDGLDGQVVSVRVPPVVRMRYEQAGRSVNFLQAATPEVLLPADVDLVTLGEIGLRILGLPPGEARQFAATIDWQTTLLVPVPPLATSFRQVDINGSRGVAIQSQRAGELDSLMLWSAGKQVFVVEADGFGFEELLRMAQSVR